MRAFSPELTSHLFKDATTLCTCWIVRRRDGAVLGFTDHDAPLDVDGTRCEAATGFEPTTAVTELGLAPDNQQIAGALSADAISSEDLQLGRYDGANVEVWLVNWARADSQKHHLRTFILGEVVRSGAAFSAELRALASLLDQPIGRTFSRSCDATVGDSRCGVDLSDSRFRFEAQVISVTDRLTVEIIDPISFDDGWFSNGKLRWVSGRNSGTSSEISRHVGKRISLWQAPAFPPSSDDQCVLTAGCNKTFAQCRNRFENGDNFRGFPHMPGGDLSLGYADRDTLHDGSPLVV
ncbi:DUF2163 domain-containing protein [Ahrensia sp. R2A130]|uniref:DUF2163 domain-containing protein n=1 Tax=Ahrensia sp. R2A130 TaxID=744979 RepID=UPI0001E0E8C7|nr:DUF2163 domain-containing protein [Ahrensia sp. R2A130]EFL88965.1 phage protein [Ahrensia sp. R2A130]